MVIENNDVFSRPSMDNLKTATELMNGAQKCPVKPVVLKNVIDGTVTFDTLHAEAYVSQPMAFSFLVLPKAVILLIV